MSDQVALEFFRTLVRKHECPKCGAKAGGSCIILVEPRFYKDDGTAYVTWVHDERAMVHYQVYIDNHEDDAVYEVKSTGYQTK